MKISNGRFEYEGWAGRIWSKRHAEGEATEVSATLELMRAGSPRCKISLEGPASDCGDLEGAVGDLGKAFVDSWMVRKHFGLLNVDDL
jgi:hypothetical protein